jgi:hypothetical protein
MVKCRLLEMGVGHGPVFVHPRLEKATRMAALEAVAIRAVPERL